MGSVAVAPITPMTHRSKKPHECIVGDPPRWNGRRSLRFDADVVVDGYANPLLAAEIALSGLHGNVPEKELDLFQFSA